jgi:hypothetical protein
MATWKQLESSRMVKAHKTSASEIETHFAVVDRNMADAAIPQLSDDGRFLMAYNAAFHLSTIVLFASGFEAHGDDHHKVTFSALPTAMGPQVTLHADYFDRCRRKRNNIQYDQVNVATKSESDELYKKVLQFETDVTDWLSKHHPELLQAAPVS